MKKFLTGFLAIIWIAYLMGIVGLTKGVKRKSDKALTLFTVLACINVIIWIVTIKIII